MVSVNLNANIFEKLSENAKISLRNAAQVASHFGSSKVEPEHIFFGILLNKKSLTFRLIKSSGIDPNILFSIFEDLKEFTINSRTSKKKTQMNFSPQANIILRKAFQFANDLSHVYVGTEHIFFSILENSSFKYSNKINQYGLNLDIFRDALLSQATYPIGLLSKPEEKDNEVIGGKQSLLEQLGCDLVELAKKGELDPLVGRKAELDNVVRILSRRRKNNPIIIGESGVGKTALVEGLAERISKGKVPFPLLNMKVFLLDVSSIIASSKLRGDIEEKIISIINEVVDNSNIIVFIDEIHNILSSSVPGSGVDIASVLKPALLEEKFRCIGATTTESYTQHFGEDTAFSRRFQPVKLEEPSLEESEKILKRVSKLIEKHQRVKITDEAIKTAVLLSHRYVSDRYLPDKAIDLLDEAAAVKRMEVECKFENMSKLYMKSKGVFEKKKEAIQTGDLNSAKKLNIEEKELQGKIKKLEKERESKFKCEKVEVDVHSIRKVLFEWTGIPITTLDDSESKKLLNLNKILSESIIGQKEAVQSVSNAIKRSRAGISSPERPWASFLFLGPTGVGKTEMAKVLTREIFGSEDRLIQIDMSEMMEMHSVSKLIGSPPGYVGYKEGGQLTEIVKKTPHCVILFDEIEKAHEDVLNILLQILEAGHLTDAKGKRVNFKNTIIILTSNIGAEEIVEDKVLGFSDSLEEKSKEDVESAYEGMKADLTRILKNSLKPELINRLDDIVIFRSLVKADASKIVQLLLDGLNERLSKEKGVFVSLDTKAINYLVENGFSLEYGARPLRRIVQEQVENTLAEWVLKNKNKDNENTLEEVKFFASKDGLVVKEK